MSIPVTVVLPETPCEVDPAAMANTISARLIAGEGLAVLHATWTAEIMSQVAFSLSFTEGGPPTVLEHADVMARLTAAVELITHASALQRRAITLCRRFLDGVPVGTSLAGITRTEDGWDLGSYPLAQDRSFQRSTGDDTALFLAMYIVAHG